METSQQNICLKCDRCGEKPQLLSEPFATQPCPFCTQSQLAEPLLHASSPLSQSSVYCRAMTGSLSSCCQISEREKETASGRDRERGVMIEIVVGWTLSLLYITFFSQSAVFSQSRGERVKYCLLLNHQLSELVVSQLAFTFFTLLFFCHLSLPLKSFFFPPRC